MVHRCFRSVLVSFRGVGREKLGDSWSYGMKLGELRNKNKCQRKGEMDLFVEPIDSKLLTPEKYKKLINSRKNPKKNETNESDDSKNKKDGSDLSDFNKNEDENLEDTEMNKTSSEDSKSDSSQEEQAKPFLNYLIDKCTDFVRTANSLSGPNYRNSSPTNAGSLKLSQVNKMCKKATKDIRNIVQKMASEHVFDQNTNPLDVLFDEIEFGLKKHNKEKYAKELELNEEVEVEEPSQESDESGRSKTGKENNVNLKKRKTVSRQELMELENETLKEYSIDIDLSNYKFKQRPQDKWKDTFDNFSTKFNNTQTHIKYNKIEPQIKFAKKYKQTRFFEKNFVPKIYPKKEYLPFIEKVHLVSPHLYSQELNSLVWSEEEGKGTHEGYELLGGEGNLFKITEEVEISEIKYKYVTNKKEFEKMIEKIKKCKILSIDVEHHDKNTYRGYICLIQLSTREENYIVDPFEMFTEINKLNKVTTDPKILKLMHGAGNDVLWLQRDFGVYIVNLFDTREAAKIINLPEQSLSRLIQKYFNVTLNKKYQLADWSRRPLDEEMLDYACSDTYYLIPLYTKMKNQILERKDGRVKILQIMNNSRNICLKQYSDKGLEVNQKLKSICMRNKIQPSTLDFVSYNFFLNLISFRNYAARKLDVSEQMIIRDFQISIIIKRMKSGCYPELLKAMMTFLEPVKYEIANLIRIKNSIDLLHKKLQETELLLIRPRSIKFILNCLENKKPDEVKENEFEKLKHRLCIDNTLKVYNRFVACGLFNNISPTDVNVKTPEKEESKIEKSATEKRSLAEEAKIVTEWKRKKINI